MITYLRLLEDDVSTTGLFCEINIFDVSADCWVKESDLQRPEGFDGNFVGALPGWLHAISATGETPVILELMSAAQEWVMDESGKGWPELLREAHPLTCLLTPGVNENGEPAWTGGGFSIPLGRLRSATSSVDCHRG